MFWKNLNELFDQPKFIFLGSKITAAMKLKDICSLEEKYDQPRQRIKKQRHYLPEKIRLVKAMISSSHIRMWELDYKESWVPKNCGVREDSWESLGLQGGPTSQS